ncbi:MAG: hypothetical protein C4576_08010 [Desulfobacteraceae bacterium]|nr:MAG: hypothetical protein C4576_08010 [Desulfobacteraceae bacterium]
MSWKFWTKGASGAGEARKLPGPQGMPNQVGRDLVVNKGENPDWVWGLKCVTSRNGGEDDRYFFRIFDEEDASKSGIAVRNYATLDQSPELILFEGWYSKKTNKAEVVKRSSASLG